MASRSCSSVSAHLPDECWELVFKNLGDLYHETLSLVSRQFLSLTNRLRTSLTVTVTDPVLPLLPALLSRFPNLTSINLTTIYLHLSFIGDLNAFLTQIASSDLPSLHSLSLSYIRALPTIGLRNFALKFPTLKSLTCYRIFEVALTDLELIASCFPSLEELDLSLSKERAQPTIPGDHGGGDGGNVEAMASGLQKLRKVKLSNSFLLRGPFLRILCRNCESLEELHLDRIPSSEQSAIVDAIRERPGIRSLTVHSMGLESRDMSLELIHALLSLKGLTCLDLSCIGLCDAFLCAVADAVLPMRKLKLRKCFGSFRFGLSYLLSKCNLLQHLDLGSVELSFPPEDPFTELFPFLPNLISLDLGRTCWNVNVTELTFFAVVRNCPLITEICMDWAGFGTKKVDEASLMSLPVNCNVKILNLCGNRRLKDESVIMIASVCPNLEEINLGRCSSITDRAALEVLKRCPKITRFDVAFSGVTQFQVDFQVPELLELDLSGSVISDETLSAISKRCCRLRQLKLEFCKEITAKGVKKVVENCKQLKMMSLSCCDNVGADVVPWLVVERPSLRMLIPPPTYPFTDSQDKFFLHHGCNVTWGIM